MCHNYLGGMYLRTFSNKTCTRHNSLYGYITKKHLLKQAIRPFLFLCIIRKTIKTNIQQSINTKRLLHILVLFLKNYNYFNYTANNADIILLKFYLHCLLVLFAT